MVNIKNINVNRLVTESKKFNTSFEINPLDINLAKIQESFTERLEREMAEYGDFAPVVEKYESENPLREFSTIKISCNHDRDSLSKTVRNLDLSVRAKAEPDKFPSAINEYVCTIRKGPKDDIINFVKDREFFETTKKIIMLINDEIKGAG